ncbi:MAG: deoxyribose-phosphate aldolase [Burkholderiaceae bacterium]
MTRDSTEVARIALACLDLTSLNASDTPSEVAALCELASATLAAHGGVAAICVWPQLARFARTQLPNQIAVAAVANFPEGSTDVDRALRDTGQIVDAGAQEVDVVLPYRALRDGNVQACTALLDAVRRACDGLLLKVILETGELREPALIDQAARIALDAGADFLKTSTGKTPVSATPQAALTMLSVIASDSRACARVGFKASGGVRSVADAARYCDLVERTLGAGALAPERFRIGASALLADIQAVLGAAARRERSDNGY